MKDFKEFQNYEEAFKYYANIIKNGITIEEILPHIPFEPYFIIENLLLFNKEADYLNNSILDYHKKYMINQDKVVLISDTHIGGIMENYKLIQLAYEYAYKNGIKNVIHLGDLIQGYTDTNSVRNDFETQIKKLNYIFGHDAKDFNNYLLLGNHEFNLNYFNNIKVEEYMKLYDNLTLLGVQNSYFYLNDDNPINIFHYISILRNYKTGKPIIPNIKTDLSIEGHSHVFLINDNIVKIRALGSLNGNINDSGFIELSNEGNEYILKDIGFTDNKNIRTRSINRFNKTK